LKTGKGKQQKGGSNAGITFCKGPFGVMDLGVVLLRKGAMKGKEVGSNKEKT